MVNLQQTQDEDPPLSGTITIRLKDWIFIEGATAVALTAIKDIKQNDIYLNKRKVILQIKSI